MRPLSDYVVLFCAAVGILVSSGLGWVFRNTETNTIGIEFRQNIDANTVQLKTSIALHTEIVYSLGTLFESSELVTLDEFDKAAGRILTRHPDIKSILWAQITRDIGGISLPIKYSRGNIDPLFPPGQDLYSISQIKNLLDTPKPDELIVISSGNLPDHFQGNERICIFTPILRNSGDQNVAGYVGLEMEVSDLVHETFLDSQFHDTELSIFEEQGEQNRVIFSHVPNAAPEGARFGYRKLLIDLGGRRWYLDAQPTTQYVTSRRSALPYVVFAFGALFVLLSAAYLIVTLHHTQLIGDRVERRTRELQEATTELERLTRMDSLTNVANRRSFDEFFEREWARAAREQIPLTIIMMDIDHFKPYNDHYGHPAGDECLRKVARSIRESFKRPSDMVARYGGEEFAVILPNTSDAFVLAELCRISVSNLNIEHKYSTVADTITISVGLSSTVPATGSGPDGLLKLADQALYEAKNQGRNRTIAL